MIGEWLNFWLNYGLAWVSVLLAALLAVKYIIRKLSTAQKGSWKKLNRALGRSHIVVGVVLVVIGFVHGLASSQAVFSLNIGTLAWVLSALLGVNYAIRKIVPAKGKWILWHRFLTIVFAASIVIHVIDVGGIGIFTQAGRLMGQGEVQPPVQYPAASSVAEVPVSSAPGEVYSSSLAEQVNDAVAGAVFTDGTYTGVADGFGPDLTVAVTIQDNKITEIKIVSHNERNKRYYALPMSRIPEEIIAQQSLDVQAVAGATYTSVGIVNAVYDALSQALVSGTIQ